MIHGVGFEGGLTTSAASAARGERELRPVGETLHCASVRTCRYGVPHVAERAQYTTACGLHVPRGSCGERSDARLWSYCWRHADSPLWRWPRLGRDHRCKFGETIISASTSYLGADATFCAWLRRVRLVLCCQMARATSRSRWRSTRRTTSSGRVFTPHLPTVTSLLPSNGMFYGRRTWR